MNHIFYAVGEIITALIVLIFVYEMFLADYIEDTIASFRQKKVTTSNFDKIARIKLVSDDPKEIEKFITENTQFLSDSTVQHLVDRIAELKADKAIDAETNKLKSRIDSSLEPDGSIKAATLKGK